jgi:hypothetical protein
MSDHYILEGREAKPVDMMTWAKWLESTRGNRHIKKDVVNKRRVSTVFLGLDHQFGEGPPLIFETMVFRDENSFDEIYCDRCSTYDEAEAMHEKACQWVRDGEPERP